MLLLPFTTNRGKWGVKWAKFGGGGGLCGQKKFSGAAGTQFGCSSLFTIGVGLGVLGGGGGVQPYM